MPWDAAIAPDVAVAGEQDGPSVRSLSVEDGMRHVRVAVALGVGHGAERGLRQQPAVRLLELVEQVSLGRSGERRREPEALQLGGWQRREPLAGDRPDVGARQVAGEDRPLGIEGGFEEWLEERLVRPARRLPAQRREEVSDGAALAPVERAQGGEGEILVCPDVLEDERRSRLAAAARLEREDELGADPVMVAVVVDLAEERDGGGSQAIDQCIPGDLRAAGSENAASERVAARRARRVRAACGLAARQARLCQWRGLKNCREGDKSEEAHAPGATARHQGSSSPSPSSPKSKSARRSVSWGTSRGTSCAVAGSSTTLRNPCDDGSR